MIIKQGARAVDKADRRQKSQQARAFYTTLKVSDPLFTVYISECQCY